MPKTTTTINAARVAGQSSPPLRLLGSLSTESAREAMKAAWPAWNTVKQSVADRETTLSVMRDFNFSH